jgi:hypothetical protein
MVVTGSPAFAGDDTSRIVRNATALLRKPAYQPSATASPTPSGALLLVAALIAAGFALTMVVFYPGYMTIDAGYIYTFIEGWHYGDWQSPVMSVVWWLIDPIAPGSASMFLLMATLYWLGFGVVALTVARRSAWAGLAVPLLALSPPAFAFVGFIWRDVLFTGVWLVAAAIAYAAADRAARWRWLVQALALLLVAVGVLLRPNAMIAAPLLAAYVLWPTGFPWKRAAIFYVPAAAAGYLLVQLVYYGVLDARREKPLHSLLVFDLGGITHFSGENQFPVTWSAEETALLTSKCYDPVRWDTYWTIEPCRFVMARLETKGDVIFGSPRLVDAWRRAVTAHPFAYLRHRATFLWTFLAGSENLTLPLYDGPTKDLFAKNRYFMALVAVHDALKSTPLFRPGFWLILAAALLALAARARPSPASAFAAGVTASAIVYALSFFVLGVATDFRYAYWCVVATLAGGLPALLASRDRRAKPLS